MDKTATITISSNTLFHFTCSIEYLTNILSNEFRPHFCLENFSFIVENQSEYEELEFAVPMVCFCDIPLSQIGSHLSIYGNYGLGLSKEWGKRNGVAPVLYTYGESLLAKNLQLMVKSIKQEDNLKTSFRSHLLEIFYDLTCFVKPYEGDFFRKGKVISNVRFYNEREWRYIPKLDKASYRYGLKKDKFIDPAQLNKANKILFEKTKLSFEPKDIK